MVQAGTLVAELGPAMVAAGLGALGTAVVWLRARAAGRREAARRRAAEADLLKHEGRLVDALEALRSTRQQLAEQQRLAAMGQLTSGVAHDFGNALEPILGYSSLMLTRPSLMADPDVVREYLGLIHTAAFDASRSVQQLRDFSRRRSEESDVRAVQPRELIDQAVALTRPRWRDQARAAGIAIDVVTDVHVAAPLVADPSALRDALVNLILNAVDALPHGGTIVVRAAEWPGWTSIEVADTGQGMTDEVRRRCLDPFFTSRGERGTGLGLAMVHRCVERHGGALAIESAPGYGTTVRLELPARHWAHAPAVPAGLPELPPTGLRILLVDDEPLVRQVIGRLLETDRHAVEVAASAGQALARLRAEPFDLLVTDQAMPGLSGERLAARAKAVAPGLPVVLLTGFTGLGTDDEGRPPEVDLVVYKPVTLARLREAIAALLPDRLPPARPLPAAARARPA